MSELASNESVITNEEGQSEYAETQEAPTTYTQEEVDALIQKEADKRVSQAMKTAEAKREKAVREAQKVAAMNASEKFQYELEQREAAIAAKEKELALSENKNICSKILSEKGISLAFVDFVVAEEAEVMHSNIKVIEKAFKDSVKAEVEKRLGAKEPKANLGTGELTQAEFNKLTVSELAKLQVENPELFNKFF